MTRHRALRDGLFAAAILLAAGAARADSVIYSNFGSPASFDPSNGWSLDGGIDGRQELAVEFTPSTDYLFTGAMLAVGISFTDIPTQLIYGYIASDQGDAPATDLADLAPAAGQTVSSWPSGSILNFSCSTCPQLDANTPYWLVVFLTTSDDNRLYSTAVWSWNTIFDATDGSNFEYNDTAYDTGWVDSTPGYLRPAFEIDGTAVVTTPEPGALTLIAFGAAAFAAAKRTRSSMRPGQTSLPKENQR